MSLSLLLTEFASICQQSTDFHFPDMDTQLRVVQQAVHKGNVLRKAHKADERDRGKCPTPPSLPLLATSPPVVTTSALLI